MTPLRLLSLLQAGKARGLAERLWARLPPMGGLDFLPALPPLPDPVDGIRPRSGNSGPLRVRLVTPSFRQDGAPLSLLDLGRGLTADGRFAVSVSGPSDGALRAAFLEAGMDVHHARMGLGHLYGDGDFTKAAAVMAQDWRDACIDVVLANTLLAAPAVEAARLAGLPVVWMVRETYPPRLAFRPFGRSVERRCLACLGYARSVVFVAEASLAPWAALIKPSAVVVSNALAPWRIPAVAHHHRAARRAGLGLDDAHVLVLVPGTVCARKGQRDLVLAWSLLPEAVRDVLRIVAIGDVDAEPATVRALRREMEMLPQGAFRLLPAQAEMASWFAAADVVALPSRSEAAPRVLLEAMAAGKPVVTTSLAAMAEMLGTSAAALFHHPGDPKGLAAVLTQLALSSGLRARMGQSGRARFAAINDFPGMVERYARLLERAALCGEAGASCAA